MRRRWSSPAITAVIVVLHVIIFSGVQQSYAGLNLRGKNHGGEKGRASAGRKPTWAMGGRSPWMVAEIPGISVGNAFRSLRNTNRSRVLANKMQQKTSGLKGAIPTKEFRIEMLRLSAGFFAQLEKEKNFWRINETHFDWWAFPSTVAANKGNFQNFKMSEEQMKRFAHDKESQSAYMSCVKSFLAVQLRASLQEMSWARMGKIMQSLMEWHQFAPPIRDELLPVMLQFAYYVSPSLEKKAAKAAPDYVMKAKNRFVKIVGKEPFSSPEKKSRATGHR